MGAKKSAEEEDENKNPAALAIWRNQLSLFEKFLSHGLPVETRVVKLSYPRTDAVTFLHPSFSSLKSRKLGDTTITKMPLDRGADVNNRGNCSASMLHYIIDPDPGFEHALPSNLWLTLFLEHGAVVDERDIIGQTPLHIAAFSNSADAIEVLLKYGADINARSHNCDHTALKMAIVAEMPDSERVLREHGATEL
ncbi:Similar to Ankyrin repeat and SOCS box protein 8; acc. no. Q4R544 [Pyronema omphalodes CBS 100304]|uniref:Similar to Ankyrin repeat and SOCS box protein 8 acc. no. Q4R544 n=1 Tax=Pyronema omphalodes (strain CBS 100304) TaxID=1076935 RepID=U4LRW0_PYROM|nr:Similar to Ankyrin repeat and SOCS box protein 8; acc. no. Q4R544 [Pyronema omphalodes CBS 100304]